MGWRIRKSIDLGLGFKINISKSGVGYSWGVPGYRKTWKANGGKRITYSIPGSGISYVKETSTKKYQTHKLFSDDSKISDNLRNTKQYPFVRRKTDDLSAHENKMTKFSDKKSEIIIISIVTLLIILLLIPLVLLNPNNGSENNNNVDGTLNYTESPDTYFYYQIIQDEVYIDGITDEAKGIDNISIPAKIKNLPVVSLNNTAAQEVGLSKKSSFKCKAKTLTIPSSIKKIDTYFFSQTEVEKLILKEGITEIGSYAFAYSDIDEIIIPNSVIILSDYSFMISNIKKLEIPSSVTKIGDYAFEACFFLKSVIFNEGLETIGKWAFTGCGKLDKIIFPNSLKVIGESAFAGNPTYGFSMKLKEIQFGKNLEKISTFAFAHNEKLKEIILYDNLKEIQENAFYYCLGLRKVVIGKSIEKIHSKAFNSCRVTKMYLFADTPPTTGNLTGVQNVFVLEDNLEKYQSDLNWKDENLYSFTPEDLQNDEQSENTSAELNLGFLFAFLVFFI